MSEEFSNDYENRCGNCHLLMHPDDRFCRHCGTPKGRGAFLPYRNEINCVYGPPTKEVVICHSCGHRWVTLGLGGDESKFCPECRSKRWGVEISEPYEFGE